MSNIVGKCPYCKEGIVKYRISSVQGKKTKIYSCSNYKVTTEDGEVWEATADSTCDFSIFGNALSRYGKKFIGPKEVKKLLDKKDVIVHLYSFNKKVEYKKYITLNRDYGVSVLWDLDVELENEVE